MQAVRIPIASNINSKNLGVVEKCNGRERELCGENYGISYLK